VKDNSSNKRFYSHAKLMISGEYLVLEGAEALAVPLSRGQELRVVKSNQKPRLNWKTYVEENYWFEVNFSLPDLAIGNSNDFPIAQNIRDILLEARNLNPDFLKPEFHYEVRSLVDFNINWGLGSSSSLIANISKWAEIDPFDLHFRTSNGSGYDIAASLSENPVLYNYKNGTPGFEQVDFLPEFHEHIYFAYLGRKQSSARAINEFRKSSGNYSNDISEISKITRDLIKSKNVTDFNYLLSKHDKIISGIIKQRPVGDIRFPDFNGYVKALGAWGGDFAMFISPNPKEYVISYFRRKDLKHWFRYSDLVKTFKSGVHV